MHVDAVYAPDLSTRYKLPVFLGRLPAVFLSPADDYIEGKLDLNRHLIIDCPGSKSMLRAHIV
jgi:DNA polymerase V